MINDWELLKYGVLAFLQGQNPYSRFTFVHPPWIILPLIPLVWVPWWLAMFLPLVALTLLALHRRKPYLIPLVGTSFSFILLSGYANVDWLVMVGATLGGPLGVILATVKPQAGGLAFIGELRTKTWRQRILFLTPFAAVALIGTALYPQWITQMFTMVNHGANRNFGLFPYSIPVGIWALWRCWKKSDPLWGVVGSLCLSPYLYIHSWVPLQFMLADRDWRWGLIVNILTWVILVLILAKVLDFTL